MKEKEWEGLSKIVNEYERKEIEEGAALAAIVSRGLNSMGDRDTIIGFVERMGREHRTLQQGFTRLCVAWFLKLEEMRKEGWYDLRNQDAVELAMDLAPILEKKGRLRFI